MRIIVVSDTHQNETLLRQYVKQAMADGSVDVFIHCGDGVRDVQSVEKLLYTAYPTVRIYAVRGNCDLTARQYPVSETVMLRGVRTLITHGHYYQVKKGLSQLVKAAHSLHASLVFFGHTHHPLVVQKHGITLINPGPLSSRSHPDTAYLEVTIDNEQQICEKFIKVD